MTVLTSKETKNHSPFFPRAASKSQLQGQKRVATFILAEKSHSDYSERIGSFVFSSTINVPREFKVSMNAPADYFVRHEQIPRALRLSDSVICPFWALS